MPYLPEDIPTGMEGSTSCPLISFPAGAQWEMNHFTGTKLFIAKSGTGLPMPNRGLLQFPRVLGPGPTLTELPGAHPEHSRTMA